MVSLSQLMVNSCTTSLTVKLTHSYTLVGCWCLLLVHSTTLTVKHLCCGCGCCQLLLAGKLGFQPTRQWKVQKKALIKMLAEEISPSYTWTYGIRPILYLISSHHLTVFTWEGRRLQAWLNKVFLTSIFLACFHVIHVQPVSASAGQLQHLPAAQLIREVQDALYFCRAAEPLHHHGFCRHWHEKEDSHKCIPISSVKQQLLLWSTNSWFEWCLLCIMKPEELQRWLMNMNACLYNHPPY